MLERSLQASPDSRGDSIEARLRSQPTALTLIARYPNWRPDHHPDGDRAISLRGRLALETIKQAVEHGVQPILIDNGSSEKFVTAARHAYATVEISDKSGISLNRQKAIRAALASGKKFLVASDPEKVAIPAVCLPEMLGPLERGEADIVMPYRTEKAWRTYPPEQVVTEKRINEQVNALLRRYDILGTKDHDIDICFGPSAFTAKAAKYYLDWLVLKDNAILAKQHGIEPTSYGNAMMFPPISALLDGARVVSIPVPYEHPAEQTALETGNQTFQIKRVQQRKNVVGSIVLYLKHRGIRKTLTPFDAFESDR